MPSTLSEAIFHPYVFLPAFALLCWAFGHGLGRVAGWWQLGRLYRARTAASGEAFRFATGSLGHALWPVRYLRCLRGTVSAEGLHLALMAPFRMGAPPLWLPWSALVSLRLAQGVRDHSVIFEWRDAWPRVTLRGEAGQRALAACRLARPDLLDPAAASGSGAGL